MRDNAHSRDAEPVTAITLSGRLLIDNALFNKGTASTADERLSDRQTAVAMHQVSMPK